MGITAGADVISPMNSVIVGYVAGLLVVASVLFFDRLRIDDPVGAISVHLVCGIWGTLAVGIFSAEHSLITQFIGVFSYAVFCIISSFILFLSIEGIYINSQLQTLKAKEKKSLFKKYIEDCPMK